MSSVEGGLLVRPARPAKAGSKHGRRRLRRSWVPRILPRPALLTETAFPASGNLTAGQFCDLFASAPVAAFVKDADGRYIYANRHLVAKAGQRMSLGWRGKTDDAIWPPEIAALIRAHDQAVIRDGGLQLFTETLPLASGLHNFLVLKFALPPGGRGLALGGVAFDLTQSSKTEAEHDRLSAAIEQATESVMIADLDARITYVNPAFERVTGYSRAEVIGRNPSLLKSGLHPRSFYEAMWASLTSGVPWGADFVNRRKDGSLFTEEAVISPIREPSGAITSFVAVKRDVTRERALEERSTRLIRERELIADTIRSLRPGDTPEDTAQAICRHVASLTGIAAAQFILFEPDGYAMPIGFVVAGQADPPLKRLSYQRGRQLRGRASEGPWIEPWANRQDHPTDQPLKGVGVRPLAHAPVTYDGRVIGLLTIQASDTVDKAAIAEAVPALVEFTELAGALIGHDVVERTNAGRSRDRISAIIAHRAFWPVFQPIVDLGTHTIVGYEALTCFTDGADPDFLFGEAAAVGLGAELETATLEAALAAAEALPRSAWLNLNVSPELVIAGEPLRSLLNRAHRGLVIEVTEHKAIADYAAFRAAVDALGSKVELAVDDAGAGFASLRHVLELRPAFVKLDRSLIADVASDNARQAMIVGLAHFARVTGCRLIAEGIETDSELAALMYLDIQLGQGYLLGRPVAAGTGPATRGTD